MGIKELSTDLRDVNLSETLDYFCQELEGGYDVVVSYDLYNRGFDSQHARWNMVLRNTKAEYVWEVWADEGSSFIDDEYVDSFGQTLKIFGKGKIDLEQEMRPFADDFQICFGEEKDYIEIVSCCAKSAMSLDDAYKLGVALIKISKQMPSIEQKHFSVVNAISEEIEDNILHAISLGKSGGSFQEVVELVSRGSQDQDPDSDYTLYERLARVIKEVV